ncbi:alpha-tocopherol transfer protein-like [Asbolus verrucosus]|uniref:Alpha-tocopherol transfer protein-like n=1 Tax=Asbolus verrucosus TaxID=1661398 RepID=A0A482W179_ASBVE|nr:alpha-tocopherol transfer protein-like [Asbolus verrucosus]
MPIENSVSISPLRQSPASVGDPSGSISFNAEWQKTAEEELNETPENLKQEVFALRQMVQNDTSLNVLEDDAFLLRFLRARKFDSKKAFHMLQRYYLMKLKCPELFSCPAPSECSKVFDLQAQNMLQERDQLGRRVYIIRMDFFDSNVVTIDDIFRTNMLALEQIVREPETQIAGIVLILDMAGLSLQHAKFFTPYYAKKMVELVQETFPLRFKGFHIVNEPFYFDAVMAVLKPFLKEKIRKRIFLHGSDVSALHGFVSVDILPSEYGGNAGNFDNRAWYMQLLSEEEYFKNLVKFGYKIDTEGDK